MEENTASAPDTVEISREDFNMIWSALSMAVNPTDITRSIVLKYRAWEAVQKYVDQT